jgi:hypothetical protein
MRVWIGLLVVTFAAAGARAQVLTAPNDQHPPSTRWKVIRSPHFEVIAPEEILDLGQRAAGLLERAYEPLARTLKVRPKRIALVLTNQGVVSNGLVRLAPRMAEWLTTPPQSGFGGPVDWLSLLAAHEGRHIVQLDKLDRGFTRVLSVLFGDLGRGAFTLMSAPIWYLEGDAVGLETALTDGGRGRLPEFEMDIRALLLSGRRYSYDKAFLGSFKDWYPDYYHLGYLLTTYLRVRLGPDVWSTVLEGAARNSFWVFAFDRALEEESGRNVAELYDETMGVLRDLWVRESEPREVTPLLSLNRGPRPHWTSYVRPQPQPDGTVVCRKFGLDDAPVLVRLDPDGRETRLQPFAPIELYGTQATARGGRLAWCEFQPDARWAKRSFGVIVVRDLETGRTRRLTEDSRFLNAALSPDGGRLAAVEFLEDGRCAIAILDALTGRRLSSLPNPDNAYLMTPSWSEDGQRVVYARQSAAGRGLAFAAVATGAVTAVKPDGPEAVSDPVFLGRDVLYHSPLTGIDNILALDPESRRTYQLTSSRFGAFFPAVSDDGRYLYYSDYTIDGYDAVRAELDPRNWKEVVSPRDCRPAFVQALLEQEGGRAVLRAEQGPGPAFPVSGYSPAAHLLNVHSWGLFPTTTQAGLFFMSNDVLNELNLSGGPDWNFNEKTLGLSLAGSWRAWLPILDAGGSAGGRTSSYEDPSGESHSYGWKEAQAYAGFYVPLDLSRGSTLTFLSLSAGLSYRRIWDRSIVGYLDQGNGWLLPFSYAAAFSRASRSSVLDLRPTWAQRLAVVFRHAPIRSADYKGRLLSLLAGADLPGLMRHHSLSVEASYERQDPGNYRFESEVLFPRGYEYVFHEQMWRLSMDYALPLAYPDLSLGPVAYLKRIWVNLFGDIGIASDPGFARRRYDSAGMDLLFDACFFRTPVTVNFGVRAAYRFLDRTVRFQPLILGFAF